MTFVTPLVETYSDHKLTLLHGIGEPMGDSGPIGYRAPRAWHRRKRTSATTNS